MSIEDQILNEYNQELHLYEEFTSKLNDLLHEIVRGVDFRVHLIDARVKSEDSLRQKVARPDKNYRSLKEITDIAGLRIITYFEDEVDKIATLIRDNFDTDDENSVDKRALLEPDRFGYQSLQFIVQIPPERALLVDWQRFENLKAEIQLRSLLQHVWAEIYHDLGYKTKNEIPRRIQRDFARQAGLLEISDAEFIRIRDQLRTYEEEVAERIESEPDSVLIDKASLSEFVKSNETIIKLDKTLSLMTFHKEPPIYFKEIVGKIAAGLNFLEIDTITNLQIMLENQRESIIHFARRFIESYEKEHKKRQLNFPVGMSLLFLCYYQAALSRDREYVVKLLKEMGIEPSELHERFAARFIEWVKS